MASLGQLGESPGEETDYEVVYPFLTIESNRKQSVSTQASNTGAAQMALMRILRHGVPLGCLLAATGVLPAVHGQSAPDPLASPPSGIIQLPNLDGLPGGVVLNRTITVVGHDFYRYFTTSWRARDNSERYSIAIIERPTAIRGSEILVEYRNKPVFRTYLSPRRAAVKKISMQAVGLVYDTIIEKDLQELLYQDLDLAKEELQ